MFCACFSGSVQKMVQKTNGPALSLHANTWVFLYTNISRALGIFRGTAAWLAGALQCTAEAGKGILG